jgi:hypothetical protein
MLTRRLAVICLIASADAFQCNRQSVLHTHQSKSVITSSKIKSALDSSATSESAEPNNSQQQKQTQPTNFREAEVLGLRFMQDGRYEEALKG